MENFVEKMLKDPETISAASQIHNTGVPFEELLEILEELRESALSSSFSKKHFTDEVSKKLYPLVKKDVYNGENRNVSFKNWRKFIFSIVRYLRKSSYCRLGASQAVTKIINDTKDYSTQVKCYMALDKRMCDTFASNITGTLKI